jgi:cytochrome P450
MRASAHILIPMNTSDRSCSTDGTLGTLVARLPRLWRAENGVPALAGRPLLGNLLEFRNDRTGLQLELARRGPLVRFYLGFMPAYMASSVELAHEILVEKADAFVKSAGLSTFARPLLGNGLLTSEHDVHRRQRRLLAPRFTQKHIARFAETMADRAERAQAGWEHGLGIDVADEMMRLTLGIVTATLFDAEIGEEATEIGAALTGAQQDIIDSITSLVPLPPSWPTPRNLRHRRSVARLDRTLFRLIDERRDSAREHGDLLGMLLAARDDDGGGMSNQQVRDEAMTLFLAGHETTANALSWALYLLAKHPDARERFMRELDSVLGGRQPALEDLPRLPFSLQIVKEAMRLYPPAYILGRMAEADVTIGGHALAAGSVVFVNVFGIHRSPRYHAEPERFDPDRFAPAPEKALPRHAFMPFGAGPRVCIGNHFALMEAQIVLAAIGQRVVLDVAASLEPALDPLITLRPKGGIPMAVSRRRARASPRAPLAPCPPATPA